MSFQNGMTGKQYCPFILHNDGDWLVTIKARCMYTVCVAYIWSAVWFYLERIRIIFIAKYIYTHKIFWKKKGIKSYINVTWYHRLPHEGDKSRMRGSSKRVERNVGSPQDPAPRVTETRLETASRETQEKRADDEPFQLPPFTSTSVDDSPQSDSSTVPQDWLVSSYF